MRSFPFISSKRKTRFCLTESLVKFQSRSLEEFFVNLGVERLAGGGAVGEGRQVEFRQVCFDEKAVDCRGSAESCYLIFFNHFEQIRRLKTTAVIVNKYARAGYHLTVKLAPNRFSPACVGDGEMESVVFNVVPVCRSGNVSERISKVVANHLRLARCARCKIQKHSVFNACFFVASRTLEYVGRSLNSFFKAVPALFFSAVNHDCFNRGRLRQTVLNVFCHNVVVGADNHFNFCTVASVNNVFFC